MSSETASAPSLYLHTPTSSPVSEESEALYEILPAYHRQSDGTPDYLRMILGAHLYDLVRETSLQTATRLSSRLGCEILLKREDLQPVFSFKLRGAYNMMRQMDESLKWKGVIACSAGNHAQGVALAGAHLSIPCTIVMPRGTPSIKWENVQRLGAKVVFHGANFDEAKKESQRLAKLYGLTMIPPFDHPQVIAGQGTTAVEICNQTDMEKVDAVFCAVGGGGLLSGVAAYIKRIAPPHVKVFGVETFDADALAQSLEHGERVELNEVGLFSDGTAVRLVGDECFRICNSNVDGIVRVSNDEICAAIKDVFEDTRAITEPAGALAVAGTKRYIAENGGDVAGRRFVAVVSGANMNFNRLRFVSERAELGEKREAILSVTIPDEPGSFLKLSEHIVPRDVTEFSYRFSGSKYAHIFTSFVLNGTVPTSDENPLMASVESLPKNGMSLRDLELQGIIRNLNMAGMKAVDISDNEFVKAHGRYMIGGREAVPHERLFRFRFPERPGALQHFLVGIDAGWNISLFHYRQEGADIARVLAGIQVPPDTEARFDQFLHDLGYAYHEETDNPIYQLYLRDDSA
ncbi:threonine deaminase [Malassezia pachydermatis]|uniref:Threonine dehydratase n=1 Tax=Malassezia pachydermatis TaxID=77020 RepID=A0A0M9VQ93_9BASI|nr:threonine ammonia-lyase [Malassezia pachydermatis]KOS15265.1 threonine ammonia-lyase [Malassezia pachydermatis]